MVNTLVSTAVCSACGEPLGTKDACLPCLLRAGLDDAGDSADSHSDTVFGDFEIERREDGSLWELGRGAMGVTYRASDKVLHRTVALKVIEPPAAATDAQAMRERFLREARAAAALRHPNIAGVFHFGAAPQVDRCYCAMELVEGETLEARVRREGPLKLDVALEVAVQVTRALMAAAERGLVHRDLKPGNIMLAHGSARLEVKVIDFGLAKAASDVAGEMELTHGGFVGTPAFASPEQFAGDTVDARSDIYALGVTLWFALSGRLPFAGKTIDEIREQQAHHSLPLEQLKARGVPEAVLGLLQSCLAIDPAKRPASAGELVQALESCRARSATREWFRKFVPFVVVLSTLVAGLSAFLLIRPKEVTTDQPAVSARPIEKGIAVLPFENLSTEKDDAFFTDGIQDDVLTSLGKIKGLKVIARASVMDYRGARIAGKVRKIGQTLGVSHVLEGSVRRMGDRVVLNVALIDTRSERRLWAERYERTMTDAISLQGDLAIEIARALHATLTPAEAIVASAKATQNPEAYLLYLRGRESEIANNVSDHLEPAIQLYQQAIDLDPKFALARARLSLCANLMGQYDPIPWKEKARAEAKEAVRLQPQLGEARLALTHCYLFADGDMDRAQAELTRAAELLPNSAEVPMTAAFIYKRQNKFRDRVAALQRAEALDPRSRKVLGHLTNTHRWVRDWPAALSSFDRKNAMGPEALIDKNWWWSRENDEFRLTGDINVLKKALAEDPDNRALGSSDYLKIGRYDTAMLERDYTEAARFLSAIAPKTFSDAVEQGYGHSKAFNEALLAVAGKTDPAAKQHALEVARDEAETRLVWKDGTADEKAHADLALIYMFLGRKEEAVRTARHAIDAVEGTKAFGTIENNDLSSALAMVYANTGESEKAIDLIEHLLTVPTEVQRGAIYNMTLTDLKWRWQWDPLRGNPRFQKLLAGPEPKTVY